MSNSAIVPVSNNDDEYSEETKVSTKMVGDLIISEYVRDKVNFARITTDEHLVVSLLGFQVPIISSIEFKKSKNKTMILDWEKTVTKLIKSLKTETNDKMLHQNIRRMITHNYDKIKNFLLSEPDVMEVKDSTLKNTTIPGQIDECDACDKCDKEIIDVSQALKRNSGNMKVKGTIATLSEPIKMIKSYSVTCSCSGDKNDKVLKYPIFKLPFFQSNETTCNKCKTKLVFEPQYVNAMSIELQDGEKFNDMEKVSCILLDSDPKNIRIGENVVVSGDLHVLPKNQKGNLIPFVFCKNDGIEWLEANEIVLNDLDIEEIKSFANTHGDSVISRLVDMFDNSIIGMREAKESLLYSLVSAVDDSVDLLRN